MACYIKLKDDCYILWSKAGDCPAERKLFTQDEVLVELQKQHKVLLLMGQTPIMSPSEIITWIETYGTSDLGKGVNKEFIEQYNTLGPSENALSADEIIKLLS